MIELLSPAGDFDCLKAAVQNGADCVYFGANEFSARASASNFDLEHLEKAIQYAKLRGVKTNLTLNTLIKNTEFENAYNLAKKAYEFGIDAIIVQDLGLGIRLIKDFPDLPIHASTQMSAHNLQGVLELQELGFKRVVLARELSATEIEYICKNSNVEIECFIHGALCISYSGQCLFSSMIGGRSGNRGKCAQPCRLPYSLVDENEKTINQGYLLSSRDLCGLEFIPFLVNAGVTSFKIEGRMKTPEYVATVTRIYKKYLDMAQNNDTFEIDEQDRKDLLQVFNRGLSSCGHLEKDANKNLVFKEKPSNMGLPLGVVQKYNKSKGYITIKLKEPVEIGDTISLEHENGVYTISELMEETKKLKLENISIGKPKHTVVIGRMKGNIKEVDKVYKMSSKELNTIALTSLKSENRKIPLKAKVIIKENAPTTIQVENASNVDVYKNMHIECHLDIVPVKALKKPLTEEAITEKINKTGNTFFEFSNIKIELGKNLFIPKLSDLNELRRLALADVEKFALEKISRKTPNVSFKPNTVNATKNKNYKISLLLNILNLEFDYSKLENIDKLYIPLKYFSNKNYTKTLELLNSKFDLYIYMPTIIKANYRNIFYNNIENAIKHFNIKGLVISNISNFLLLNDICEKNVLEIIANYTLNIYNNYTIDELKKLGISTYTVSPELDSEAIKNLNYKMNKELIVYGKIPVINSNYCLLGNTNKCYPNCEARCQKTDKTYYLKDRLNMNFEILPDNIQTVTTIYNSKTLSILPSDFDIDFARIDILKEDIDEINKIVNTVRANKRFEGKEFTNGNLNRVI